MLNFTLKPGEYFTIGENIRVVVTGGTRNNFRIMVDAPRELNIVRGTALEKHMPDKREQLPKYYPEPDICRKDMQRYIVEQKKR